MNEQTLLDYELSKFVFEEARENLLKANSKLFNIRSVNFDKVGGRGGTYVDKATELINQKDEAQRKFDAIACEFVNTKNAIETAIRVLDASERLYFHKRYILGEPNPKIALSLRCNLEYIYYLRKSILKKIESL